MLDWIYSFFPPHNIFVDVFGGSGVVLLNKPVKSKIEIFNDIDKNIISFFRVLRDKTEEFIQYLELTPISRDEFIRLSNVLKDPDADEFQKAVAVYYIASISFNSKLIHPTFSVFDSKKFKKISYFNKIPKLQTLASRLRNVIIENLDYKKCILRYDSENTLFYMDPPYPILTRNSDRLYINDWQDEEHIDFIDFIIKGNFKGSFIISSYPNPIYDKLLEHGFELHTKEFTAFGSGVYLEDVKVDDVVVKRKKEVQKSKRIEALYIKTKNKIQEKLL